MEKIRRILLTGASGTVGQEVLNQLTQKPSTEITVFDIANSRSKKLFEKYGERIRVIYGDISNQEEVAQIPEAFDTVIHLAAIIPPLADQFPELTRKVNVSGTKHLVEHIQKTSPNAFFLYSSSVSVYGDRVETPFIHVTENQRRRCVRTNQIGCRNYCEKQFNRLVGFPVGSHHEKPQNIEANVSYAAGYHARDLYARRYCCSFCESNRCPITVERKDF